MYNICSKTGLGLGGLINDHVPLRLRSGIR